jgi:hypothetical protein
MISGAEVPRLTIVKPINNGEIPKFRAMAEAPSTNQSAAKTRTTKPSNKARISINIFLVGSKIAYCPIKIIIRVRNPDKIIRLCTVH